MKMSKRSSNDESRGYVGSHKVTKSDIPELNVVELEGSSQKLPIASKYLPTPIKSLSDKKEYRALRLENGLTALLISDVPNIPVGNDDSSTKVTDKPSESESSESDSEGSADEEDKQHSSDEGTEFSGHKKMAKSQEEKMAAVGLCIGVGSFSDPWEIPGMAHFLEHMVFMGSKKYPKENDFDSFIKKRGGSDNAGTECEHTTFYFESQEKYLAEAMDRFAQFFIAPLMKREAMTREREAIESEFQMSLPSHFSRKQQLLSGLAQDKHPTSKFTWGNLKTLQDNVSDDELYNAVHEFRKRHYSAHRMTLAVQARLPLSTLEEWVWKYFSAVPSNGLPPDDFKEFAGKSFDTPEFKRLYRMDPIKDLCQVELTWAMPSLIHLYRSKPLHYISTILAHEGKGSLLAYLRKKVWALEIFTGDDSHGFDHNSMHSLMHLTLVLTDAGYKNLSKVLDAVFSYIRLMQSLGPCERLFNELKTIEETSFRFTEEVAAADYVEALSESMQFYPPTDYICGPRLYFEYDPEGIKECLDALTPDTVNIIVSAKNSNVVYDKVEPWFGTKYTDSAQEDQLKAMSKHTRQHRDRDQQMHAFEILDQPEILYPEGEEEELADINMSNEQSQRPQQAMNIDQRQLFSFITESIKDQINGDKKRERILINGGAGTGKTVLFNLLKNQVNWCYGKLVVKVGALTGVAARLVGGSTLHRLLKLAVQKDGVIVNMPLLSEIPAEWLTSWKSLEPYPDFTLPEPNIFLTENFSLKKHPDPVAPYPIKIHGDELSEIWYRPDDKFKLPIAYLYYYFISPLPLSSPVNAVMLDMFVVILKQLLVEDVYPAEVAQLSAALFSCDRGMVLKIDGFNEKLQLLLETIIRKMATFDEDLTQGLFDAMKEEQTKFYYNSFLKPNKLVKDLRFSLILQTHWTSVDRQAAISEVTLGKLKDFSSHFRQHLYIQSLVQGNYTEQEALDACASIIQGLKCGPLLPNTFPEMRVAQIPLGYTYCSVKSYNEEDSNSIITNYYQSGLATIRNSCIIELLMLLMDEPIFDHLRTKEQLGYHVYCMLRDTFGIIGFSVTVNCQAGKHSTEYVDSRIEAFLKNFSKTLKKMPEKDVEGTRQTLIKLKQCCDLYLKEEVNRNWDEILSMEFIFNRLEREVETVKTIKTQEIRKWLDDHTESGNKSNFRKLSTQVIGHANEEKDAKEKKAKKEKGKASPSPSRSRRVCENWRDTKKFTRKVNGELQFRYGSKTDFPLQMLHADAPNHISNIEDFKRGLFLYPVHKNVY